MQMTGYHKGSDLKIALTIVWVICSISILIILILPYIFDNQTLLKYSPTCISKGQHNKECSLCGMTRAFLEISKGGYRNAYQLNKASIILYFFFFLNSLFFIGNSIIWIKRDVNRRSLN